MKHNTTERQQKMDLFYTTIVMDWKNNLVLDNSLVNILYFSVFKSRKKTKINNELNLITSVFCLTQDG